MAAMPRADASLIAQASHTPHAALRQAVLPRDRTQVNPERPGNPGRGGARYRGRIRQRTSTGTSLMAGPRELLEPSGRAIWSWSIAFVRSNRFLLLRMGTGTGPSVDRLPGIEWLLGLDATQRGLLGGSSSSASCQAESLLSSWLRRYAQVSRWTIATLGLKSFATALGGRPP